MLGRISSWLNAGIGLGCEHFPRKSISSGILSESRIFADYADFADYVPSFVRVSCADIIHRLLKHR